MEKDSTFLHVKLIIAGGRDYSDYDTVCQHAEKIINGRETLILTGEAEGADALGKKFGIQKGHLIESHPAQWEKFGRAAGPKRNLAMAKAATHLLAFWDGKSRGTFSMIKEAKKRGLPTRVVRY